MSADTIHKSIIRAYLAFSIGFFLVNALKMDVYESVIAPYKILQTALPITTGALAAWGAFSFIRYGRILRESDIKIQNAVKDEFMSAAMTNAFKNSYLLILLIFGLFHLSGNFILSAEDKLTLLFGFVVSLPFFIFAIQDKLYA